MAIKILSSTGGQKKEDGSGGVEGAQAVELQIGDKTFKAEDVENLVNNSALATQKLQEVADVTAALSRYGIDAKTFVGQAEGAFSVMTELMDKGIVDAKGNLLIDPKTGKSSADDDDDPLAALLGGKDDRGKLPDSLETLFGAKSGASDNKAVAAIASALGSIREVSEKLDNLGQRVDNIDQTQYSFLRTNIQEKLQDKYKNLDADDISRVIARASRDKSKSVFDHAKAESENKSIRLQEIRKQHAKEFGIDLDKFDENKLNEQGSEGGAAVILGNKKPSFKRGKDSVSPREATEAMFSKFRSQ